MADYADRLTRALWFAEQADNAIAEVASVLRHADEYEDLSRKAMQIEADVGVFIARLKRARPPAAD